MNISRPDIRKLRQPLLNTAMTILVASAITWWSHIYLQRIEVERDEARQTKNRSELQLLQIRSETQELQTRIASYQQMQAAGLIGEGNRLTWTEKLNAIRQELQIPGMRYEFGIEKAFNPLQKDGVFSSPLHLQLVVRHEEELLKMLARIESESSALVLLRRCRLARPEHSDSERTTPLLNADCDMQWLTFHPDIGKK